MRADLRRNRKPIGNLLPIFGVFASQSPIPSPFLVFLLRSHSLRFPHSLIVLRGVSANMECSEQSVRRFVVEET